MTEEKKETEAERRKKISAKLGFERREIRRQQRENQRLLRLLAGEPKTKGDDEG